MNRRRENVFWIPVIAINLVLFLLTLEVGARIYYNVYLAKIYDDRKIDEEIRKVREAFHPDLWTVPWHEYKPNSSARITRDNITYAASINGLGYRGDELDDHKDDGYLIACFGGSTTVSGIRDNTTYPYQLQTKLRQEFDEKVSVLNCGIGGLSSSGYGPALDRLLAHVRPDLIVEYNAVNDICWEYFLYWRSNLSEIEKLLLKSYFVKLVFGDRFLPGQNQIRKDLNDHIIHNLLQFYEKISRAGIRLAICSFAYPEMDELSKNDYRYLDYCLRHAWHGDYISYRSYCEIINSYNKTIKNVFGTKAATYIPVAESTDFGMSDFTDICHMTPDGIDKKSSIIADVLRAIISEKLSSRED